MLRYWVVQQILSSSKIEVVNEKALRMLKSDIDYESDCDDSTYDTSDDNEVDVHKPDFAMEDVISIQKQNTTSSDSTDEWFSTSDITSVFLDKKYVYDTYCTKSPNLDFPQGITLEMLRKYLLELEPYLRSLCKFPTNVKWKQYLSKEPNTRQHLVQEKATTWHFKHPAVIAEIHCYLTQICKDELPGISNSVKAVKTALNDLLPEAIISTIMHFYNLPYEKALEHYIFLSHPY